MTNVILLSAILIVGAIVSVAVGVFVLALSALD
jgi:uncharacterized membrane protein